jgi:hypothetical protein
VAPGYCGVKLAGVFRALEDLTGVDADLTTHAYNIGPIAHQPTGFDILATVVGRGNPMARRERCKLDAPASEEHVASDVQRVGAVAHEGGEGSLDFAAGAGVERPEFAVRLHGRLPVALAGCSR